MRRKAHTDGAYLTKMMLRTLTEAAYDVAANGLAAVRADKDPAMSDARIDGIHVSLSSPWVISRLTCLDKRFDKDTVVTRSGVSTLVETEKAEASKLFAAGDALAIDSKLFETKVNGYPVNGYEGKKARSFEATLAVSFASRKLVRDMKSAINHSVRARVEAFHSAALLRYAAFRSVMPAHGDYAWVNVHGELSDILTVRGESCAASGSFPFGSSTLIRKLARATGESEETMASSLAILARGAAEKLHEAKLGAALAEAGAEWMRGVDGVLGAEGRLSKIYLTARRENAAFEDALRGSHPEAKVVAMDAAVLKPFVDFSMHSEQDVCLGLYALALRQAEGM